MWMIYCVLCSFVLVTVSTSGLHVVDRYGNAIQQNAQTLCYGDFYNIICQNSEMFAPIRNILGLKEPKFASSRNCSKGLIPYDRECCIANSTDCTFDSVKDFGNLLDICSGKHSCTGQKATWDAVYPDRPRMLGPCPTQSKLTAPLATQYVKTEYMCVPLSSTGEICRRSTLKGKGLFLASPGYPSGFPSEVAGYNCSCQVKVPVTAAVTVSALDVRLCSSIEDCGRTLTVGDQVYTVTQTTKSSSVVMSFVGLKELKTTWNPVIRLTNDDSKNKVYMWLYIYAQGDDMELVCEDEETITTTSTTSTTSTTTTTSTSPSTQRKPIVTTKYTSTDSTTTSTANTTNTDNPDLLKESRNKIIVQCNSSDFKVLIPHDVIKQEFPGVSEYDLSLIDPGCRGHLNNDVVIFKSSILGCGMTRQETRYDIVYQNRISSVNQGRYTTDSYYRYTTEAPIARFDSSDIKVECHLDNFATAIGHFKPTNNNELIARGRGNISVYMDFYRDYSYNYKITSYPISLGLNEDVFVDLRLDTDDKGLNMAVQRCIATPTYNRYTSKYHTLIRNGCPGDTTVSFEHTSGQHVHFRLRGFEFLREKSNVFIFCDVNICNSTDYGNRCHRNCNRRRRDVESEPGADLNLFQGPLKFRDERSADHRANKAIDEKATQSMSISASVMAISAVAMVIAAVVMVMRRRKRYATL